MLLPRLLFVYAWRTVYVLATSQPREGPNPHEPLGSLGTALNATNDNYYNNTIMPIGEQHGNAKVVTSATTNSLATGRIFGTVETDFLSSVITMYNHGCMQVQRRRQSAPVIACRQNVVAMTTPIVYIASCIFTPHVSPNRAHHSAGRPCSTCTSWPPVRRCSPPTCRVWVRTCA
jgi:hypothetical protein